MESPLNLSWYFIPHPTLIKIPMLDLHEYGCLSDNPDSEMIHRLVLFALLYNYNKHEPGKFQSGRLNNLLQSWMLQHWTVAGFDYGMQGCVHEMTELFLSCSSKYHQHLYFMPSGLLQFDELCILVIVLLACNNGTFPCFFMVLERIIVFLVHLAILQENWPWGGFLFIYLLVMTIEFN